MPDPIELEFVWPRSVTCAICDDPACTGEHLLGDPPGGKPAANAPRPPGGPPAPGLLAERPGPQDRVRRDLE